MNRISPSQLTQQEGGDASGLIVELQLVKPVFKQIRRKAFYEKELPVEVLTPSSNDLQFRLAQLE